MDYNEMIILQLMIVGRKISNANKKRNFAQFHHTQNIEYKVTIKSSKADWYPMKIRFISKTQSIVDCNGDTHNALFFLLFLVDFLKKFIIL
jgi:hypothetical protein